MTTLIAAKTLRRLLLEARFVASTVLVVLLFGLGSLIAVGRHQQVLSVYQQDLVRAQAESDLDHILLVKRPHSLDFIASGDWWDLPRLLAVGPRGVEAVSSEVLKSSFLSGVEDLDWVFLIAVVLSLLAIFISHDAVSGEREEGTLRLILAQPVRRSSVLLGSVLGLLAALLIPLFLGLLVSLLIVLASPAYDLSPHDFAGIALVAVLAVLYLALFVLLSVTVSSLTRSSSTALLWLILFWVVLVVLLPGNGGVLAALIESPPRFQDESEKISQLESNYLVSIDNVYDQVRRIVDSGTDDATIQRNLDLLRDRLVRDQAQKIAVRNRLIVSLREDFARRRLRQMALRRWTTIASPTVLFREGVERLLTSGSHDHRWFLVLAGEYQRSIRTPLQQERERNTTDSLPAMSWETRYAGFAIKGIVEHSYRGIKPETGSIPVFIYRRAPALGSIAAAAWIWLSLATLCGGLLITAANAFSRYDVR